MERQPISGFPGAFLITLSKEEIADLNRNTKLAQRLVLHAQKIFERKEKKRHAEIKINPESQA